MSPDHASLHVTTQQDVPMIAFVFPLIGLFLAPIYPLVNSTVLSTMLNERVNRMIQPKITDFFRVGQQQEQQEEGGGEKNEVGEPKEEEVEEDEKESWLLEEEEGREEERSFFFIFRRKGMGEGRGRAE